MLAIQDTDYPHYHGHLYRKSGLEKALGEETIQPERTHAHTQQRPAFAGLCSHLCTVPDRHSQAKWDPKVLGARALTLEQRSPLSWMIITTSSSNETHHPAKVPLTQAPGAAHLLQGSGMPSQGNRAHNPEHLPGPKYLYSTMKPQKL